jgi:polysaccharide export outer membrane protein
MRFLSRSQVANGTVGAVLVVGCLTMLTAEVSAQVYARQASAAGDTTAAATTLAPGDILKIAVFRNPELSCECVIAPDGSIVHPIYHELKVAGVPLASVETRIRSFLSQYESNPMVVLSPLIRVFVGGEVRQPNVYNVPPGTTIAQVIGLAGGPTDRAALDRIQVWRGTQHISFNLLTSDASATQLPIHSGDQILVARSRSFFQDFLAPASSLIAAAAAVTTMVVQLRR